LRFRQMAKVELRARNKTAVQRLSAACLALLWHFGVAFEGIQRFSRTLRWR
jgi:hypothetical protein